MLVAGQHGLQCAPHAHHGAGEDSHLGQATPNLRAKGSDESQNVQSPSCKNHPMLLNGSSPAPPLTGAPWPASPPSLLPPCSLGTAGTLAKALLLPSPLPSLLPPCSLGPAGTPARAHNAPGQHHRHASTPPPRLLAGRARTWHPGPLGPCPGQHLSVPGGPRPLTCISPRSQPASACRCTRPPLPPSPLTSIGS